MRELRDAVSTNQQEVMTIKTHWDCVLSFALAGGGGVNGRVERDEAIRAVWLTILPDSCLFTRDSSEGIEA